MHSCLCHHVALTVNTHASPITSFQPSLSSVMGQTLRKTNLYEGLEGEE